MDHEFLGAPVTPMRLSMVPGTTVSFYEGTGGHRLKKGPRGNLRLIALRDTHSMDQRLDAEYWGRARATVRWVVVGSVGLIVAAVFDEAMVVAGDHVGWVSMHYLKRIGTR